MTHPRQIVAGRTYLITRRCTGRRFLLRPDQLTTQLFLYALAEAVQRFGIRILAWVAMSNHYHAVVEDPHGQLPAFLCHFHKMSARSLNRRWRRCENFWAAEQASVVRLVQHEDVLDKVVYALVNPILSHLVERMVDWPGASSFALLDGSPIRLERPHTFYRDVGTMPPILQLRAEPPTGWPGGAEAWAAAVRAAVEVRVAEANAARRKAGKGVVGRRAILEANPNSSPRTFEPRRKLRPEIACLNAARRLVELAKLLWFRAAHREARSRFIAGVKAVFPWGTYKFVRELGATCEATAG